MMRLLADTANIKELEILKKEEADRWRNNKPINHFQGRKGCVKDIGRHMPAPS